ncbi:hypothetical protein P0082_00950 [Candidatus Haliotispira prima]|uniref:Uncharacterized protein n=1 Tax=Candidatus Haliotispira prima TaxID=3034016 RepID=A0ABY8MHG8_9SPIO|nr:hypothetical protein P0082_00950 [Candidatus Haliotispira prima]
MMHRLKQKAPVHAPVYEMTNAKGARPKLHLETLAEAAGEIPMAKNAVLRAKLRYAKPQAPAQHRTREAVRG